MIVLAALLLSCNATPLIATNDEVAGPSYAELADAHNERVQRLSQMHSRGVIEIRWRDEDGRHFEQGNIDLWVDLPHHTALRVEKLGNVFLWLGSNEERFWLFDMLGDETILFTARHDSAQVDGAIMPVRPLALLDLVGLSMLPQPGEGLEPQVTFDDRRDAWVVTAPGQGGMMRIYFDRRTRFPVRIESLSEAGDVAYRSDMQLARYRAVPRPGAPPVGFGRMATLVDITTVNAAQTGGPATGEIKLALDAPTAFVDNQPMDRVFDLERLTRSMRPDRVEGDPAE